MMLTTTAYIPMMHAIAAHAIAAHATILNSPFSILNSKVLLQEKVGVEVEQGQVGGEGYIVVRGAFSCQHGRKLG